VPSHDVSLQQLCSSYLVVRPPVQGLTIAGVHRQVVPTMHDELYGVLVLHIPEQAKMGQIMGRVSCLRLSARRI
jgi:hypothetical protein